MNKKIENIWHPCSQMKDYEKFPPLELKAAEGCYLHLKNGKKVLDGISSWWCKSLGHGNSEIKTAVKKQIDLFEHVILANTSNGTVRSVASKLSSFFPGLSRVFFGGDGSTAVEIAVKMALHANVIKGKKNKNRLMSLQNGYHGETLLTLALSDLGRYNKPYRSVMQDVSFINSLPYVSGPDDPEWEDCSRSWPEILRQLEAEKETLCAVICEPVIQGAGGMKIYSPDFLRKLRKWTKQNDVYLIADEIMTGFGRSGKPFACNHAGIVPDMICLSKGLTAGWAAMSAVLTGDDVYELFYDDYETGKTFLHSNTFAGNPIAAAAASAAMEIYERDGIFEKTEKQLHKSMMQRFKHISEKTGKLKNVRGIGGIAAADLILPNSSENIRAGYSFFKNAVNHGAFLRPLGNTVYWLPPFIISESELDFLTDVTEKSIEEFYNSSG
ncbi:MAG: adenosylmethionine--8-amino-7-oxononanoate transaminase [bacterium]